MTETLSRRALAAILLVVGLIILVVGLFLGFRGMSRYGIACGSAFNPNSHRTEVTDVVDPAAADGTYSVLVLEKANYRADACGDATSSRTPIAWSTTIAGAFIVSVGLVLLLLPTATRHEPNDLRS